MPDGGASSDEDAPVPLPLTADWPHPMQVATSIATEPHASSTRLAPPPVPVTLITGYLGAGKTTLVNYILTAKHGCRCAVLLNEIGDSADVERALVREPEGGEAAPMADWVELENGCICCSAKNDMVKALEALMGQRDRFDYVIIETTGLANPGPVAAALWTDAELESAVCLDAVVTVVDAKNILRQLSEAPAGGEGAAGPGGGAAAAAANEAQQQLAFADVVLLNKVDLVSPQQLAAIRQEIAAINADAAVLPCLRCQVDLRHILSTGTYSGTLSGPRAEEGPGAAASAAAAPAGSEGPAACPQGSGEPAGAVEHSEQQAAALAGGARETCDHLRAGAVREDGACAGCAGHGPHHQRCLDERSRVRTAALRVASAPLDLRRLRHWLDELLWEERGGERPDVLRVKGLLWVQGSGRKHICQGVYDVYDVVEGPAWQPGEARLSKLVFIGRRLERAALEAGLARCLAGPAGDAACGG